MGTFIVLLLIGALIYWKGISEPADLKNRIKNRPKQQQDVIKYFYGRGGFLTKRISDADYDAIVKGAISQSDFKQKALEKIGLDETQVNEIEPVHFEGWEFGKKVSFFKRGQDGRYRSTAYQISWIFFSSSQVYVYQNTINFDKDDKKIATEEYFYKDITNFSTSSDTEETPYWDEKQKRSLLQNVDSNRFAITVPGDKFYCSMEQNDYTERAIQGMKAKLREKKA